MNEANIILKVLKLDRDIHRNILESRDSIRLLFPIYFIYQFIGNLSTKELALSYLSDFETFINSNPEYLGISPDDIFTISNDIADLIQIINTPFQISEIFSTVALAIIFLSIYLFGIYYGLKVKQIESSFKDLIVLYITSIIPKIFYLFVFLLNTSGTQTFLVFSFFIYSLVVRISAFKQIYFLNNLNAIIFTIWPFVLTFFLSFLFGIFA
tara:strand:+ start:37 stop:669 length:633 start_codon:yes stop_codon:yes gene_type:complete